MKEFKKDEAMSFKEALILFLEKNMDFTTYYSGEEDWIGLNEKLQNLGVDGLLYQDGSKRPSGIPEEDAWCRSYKIKDGSYMYTYTSDDNLKMYFTKGLEWM